ncbi:hypothetical protein Ahy_B06g082205 [Arachis hypogaea]|uniref:Uncharacterized protein n=1 Tax=Arachis hypogaea TaxID=3818 RepID=A0A444YN28_ARAHY|nr:hypothetical protein Ahy_B06g082205 [Arachis hypogaea]
MSSGTCDCKLFHSLHFYYCHAFAACAASSFEWGSYVHLVYLQESELKVYEVEFPPILDEKLWPEWHGACLRPNPAMCRKATGRPIFTRFRSDIDEVDCQDKRCRLCRQTGHTRRGCLNQAIEDS